jgi:Flp pilus assembly protein TadD
MARIQDATRTSIIVTLAAGLLASCSSFQLPWEDGTAQPPATEQRAAESSLPVPGGLAAVRLRVAETALKSHDTETAERLYREAHEAAPKSAQPLAGLGEAQYAQRHYDEAATAFRDALARAPNDPSIIEGLAKSLISKGSYKEARTLLEMAVKAAPSASLLNKLGVARDLSGDGPGAQAAYHAALALDPGNLSMRNNLALSLAISGQHKEAIAEMEQVAADPRAGTRYNANLAFVYGLAGDLNAAERIGGTAMNADETARLKAQYDRIRALAGTGDRAAVLAMLTEKTPPKPTPTSAQGSEPKAETRSPAVASTEPAAAPEAAVAAAKPSPAAAPTPEPAATPEAEAEMTKAVPVATAEADEPDAVAFSGSAAIAAKVVVAAEDATATVRAETAPAPEAESAPIAAQQSTEQVKVASIAKPGPSAAAPAAETEAVFSGWQVQVGAYHTSIQADRGLSRLVEKAGDVVHGFYKLERHDARDSGGAVGFRLRTPVVPDRAKAAALCSTLQERKIDCLVVHQVAGVWTAAARPSATKVASATISDGGAATAAPQPAAAAVGKTARLAQPAAVSAGAAVDSGWRVQLAAYRTLKATEHGRKILTAKAGTMLPEIQILQRTKGGDKAIDFRLRTAELPDKTAATELCEKLHAQKIECLVIRQPPDIWTAAKPG